MTVIAERYFAWSDARPSADAAGLAGRGARADPAGDRRPRPRVRRGRADDPRPGRRPARDRRRHLGPTDRARSCRGARGNVRPCRHDRARPAPASLDAVVAFYSLTHVPRADLPDLLAAMLPLAATRRRPGRVDGRPGFARRGRGRLARCADVLQPPRRQEEPRPRPACRLRDRGGRGRSGARGPSRCAVPVGRRPQAGGGPPMSEGRSEHPGPTVASLPPSIRDAIVAQARAEYPNESCGLIVGDGLAAAGGLRAPLRPDAEQGRLAVSLRDRPDRAAAPDHRDRRRRRGLLGDRPLAHPHPGRSVPDRHRAGVLPGRALSPRLAERGRGGPDDRRTWHPRLADRRGAGPRSRAAVTAS